MDAQVDNGLGDSITYWIGGVRVEPEPGVFTFPAFLIDYADDGGGVGLNGTVSPLATRWQLKIRKDALPGNVRPSLAHKITAAKLDGPYRPAANNPIDGGDYWICDLQKVPA
jgi:hypothetical protein